MQKASVFPKFLITLSLFALTAYILYALCWQTSSNFIAIVILSAIIYFCYSAYYIFPLSGKLNRCVETLRFKGFVNSSRQNVSILDYYRQK